MHGLINGSQLHAKRRQVGFQNSPQDIQVNPEIIVDENIAKASHIPPWHIWMLFADVVGDMLCRLAEHGQTADGGVLPSSHLP